MMEHVVDGAGRVLASRWASRRCWLQELRSFFLSHDSTILRLRSTSDPDLANSWPSGDTMTRTIKMIVFKMSSSSD